MPCRSFPASTGGLSTTSAKALVEPRPRPPRFLDLTVTLAPTVAVLASPLPLYWFPAPADRHWAMSDPIVLIMAGAILIATLVSKLRLNRTSLWGLLFLMFQVTSGALNLALANGTFLNSVRTLSSFFIAYTFTTVVASSARRTRALLLSLIVSLLILAVASLLGFVPFLSADRSLGLFSTASLFAVSFSTGINVFGFLSFLGYAATHLLYPLATGPVLRPLTIPLACFFLGLVVLSGSRAALVCCFLFASLFFLLSSIRRSRTSLSFLIHMIYLLALPTIAYIAISYLSRHFSVYAQYVSQKATTFWSDLLFTRVYALNLDELRLWLQQGLSTILIGDSTSIKHSIIPTLLWMYGLPGFFILVAAFISMVLPSIRHFRMRFLPAGASSIISESSFVISLASAVAVNDLIANLTMHSLTVSIAEGFLFGIGHFFIFKHHMRSQFNTTTARTTSKPRGVFVSCK